MGPLLSSTISPVSIQLLLQLTKQPNDLLTYMPTNPMTPLADAAATYQSINQPKYKSI